MSNEIKKELITLPKGCTTKEEAHKFLFDGLKTYLDEKSVDSIEKAYRLAEKYHDGQKRKSGEEYIIHPLCVCMILANLHMDVDTIIAGLLHDVVEDTKYTKEEMEKDFSPLIAQLVEGVTKFSNLNLNNNKVSEQAENLRHMFIAMSKDIRVIIIKLADRLHNLRTLEYQTEDKQKEKSLETIEIYSPIANRLGISKIKSEMDDLSLMYLKPKEYAELKRNLKLRHDARENFIDEAVKSVNEIVAANDIKCEIKGRVKNLFSIYKKLKTKAKSLDEIYDIFAIRVLVNDVKDCYACLGLIHEKYKPIPGRFKDYIAMPKQNGYQSLHTTVIGKDGIPFEIQIRTYEMDDVAEYGVAAHWAYKEQGNSAGVKNYSDLKQANWFKEILEVNTKSESSEEFLSFVKDDFDMFKSKIYCFTPEGDVISLPAGSTTIDFAYMIHSAVGNKMVGAKVNGVLVPIDYQIKNGDQISIVTSGNSQGPSYDWLKIVKSPQAKQKIQHWFKKEGRENNIKYGKELLDKYAAAHRIDLSALLKDEYIEDCLKKYTASNLDDIYAMIGYGGLKEGQFIGKLEEERKKREEREVTDEEVTANIEGRKHHEHGEGVQVSGTSGLSVHYAKCCSPVPGDEIVGYVTRGNGITIHRTDCKNIMSLPDIEKDRLIDVSWDINETNNKSYLVMLSVFCKNRKGLIVDISRILSEDGIDIDTLESRKSKNDMVTITVGFAISDKSELNTYIAKIKNVPDVEDVQRV